MELQYSRIKVELSTDQLIDNYKQLWQIEKAFRIAKSEIRIRPMYHYKRRRIEAHICLNFAAYKVYKELERFLKVKQSKFSPQKVIEIAQSIYQIEAVTPTAKERIKKIVILTPEHQQLNSLFRFGC